ncbi:Ig-like domain-containing protein [uncultured Methanobrevibacter sp.]|uniref:Ig-like domain-containing protein n=1 Tax=uncultured Methanobrevibacter sp. TaxID=253161 RepID=UPI0025E8C4B2|nr:Ig-like domain-containing protein [uncultured Methanobrevibacter sp.]
MKTLTKVLFGICMLFLVIGAVSAGDNTTDFVSGTANSDTAAELVVEDYVTEYKSFEPLKVSLKGPNGNLIKNQEISEEFYGDLRYDADCVDNTGFTGITSHPPLLEAGEYTAYISTNYQGKILYKFIDVKITKAAAKITTYKINAENTNYVTLKAKITDKYGGEIDQGKVVFTINGKTYTAYPNIDGIASKKVKLTNPGTYTFSAKYTCRNYNTVTAKSKVVLKYPTKTVTSKVTPSHFYPTIKLNKYGDILSVIYAKKDEQYKKGVYVHIHYHGIDPPKHAKLLKVKIWFKNSKGKIITKISSKCKYNGISFKLINGYTPYKAKAWYKYK